jgi:hypothetical protein
VGGNTASYTYAWDAAAGSVTTVTASGLAVGTYMVTVTDANNCTVTTSVTITEPASSISVTATQVDVKCFGEATGSALATATGGTGAATYIWSNSASGAALSAVAAGTYTVTATDANGCFASTSVTITEPTTALASTFTKTDVLCNGQANGTISVTGTGGTGAYTLASSGGTVAGMNVTGLAMGTYTLTVTDANMCTTTFSVTITQPAVLAATATNNSPVCNGAATGVITVTPTGGTSPFTYAWSPNNTGSTVDNTTGIISGLSAGAKSITITDANGCKATLTNTISQSSAIAATAIVYTPVKCHGASTGSVVFRATGGPASGNYT